MLPVEQPFKTYTGLDGKPLDQGFVYFGQPNQNPVTSPVTVYWDAAGTIPAAQPLRTVNGYIVRGGTPANVFIDVAYSELVQDKSGQQVCFARASNEFSIVGAIQSFLRDIASSIGAGMIGWIATGTGAIKRTLLDRGRDTVSAFDFMTPEQIDNVRNGVPTDVTAAVQAAINAFSVFPGTVDLPPGNFRISAPLTIASRGVRVRGASKYGTYLTAPDGATFDMLRIAAQQVEVSGIIFRPSTAAQTPLRVYAGRAHIHGNYLLAASNNAGIGILLTDIDPASGAFVPGAYVHTIENNTIGDGGFAFAKGITESSTSGIQACRFRENNILSIRPIQINKGGGNVYRDNLLQTAGSAPSGVGITLGAGVVGEKIAGNYFEGFQAMVETLNPSSDYQIFHAEANHNDACAAAVADVGAKNYVIEDTVGNVVNRFGWSTSYTGMSWALIGNSGKTNFGADTQGNCFMGASSGASHIINRANATEGAVILNFQASGDSIGYIQAAYGVGINGANTMLALNKYSTTERSINAAGTVNTSGADYAEYMPKAVNCNTVAKGQIIGITANDEITDRWADAVTFAVKSTDPSMVGGDTWFTQPRPEAPPFQSSEEEHAVYAATMQAWEAAHEAARQKVDRVAFAGRVPVNVQGATPGQFIVPVQDGAGIKGIAVSAPTLDQYMRAVGKVTAIEPDGRARIIVKSA